MSLLRASKKKKKKWLKNYKNQKMLEKRSYKSFAV